MSFIDIFVALKDVCHYSDLEATTDVEAIMNSLCLNKIDLQTAINRLSEHLVNSKNAEVLKQYISNLLLALVSAKIPLEPVFTGQTDEDIWERRTHLDNCYVLATLCDHPDILQYALKYFKINPTPPFGINTVETESYTFIPKKRRDTYHRDLTDKQIVECCYKLLNKLPNEFGSKWDWTHFINRFHNSLDIEIKWMVKECMVIVTNMSEAQSRVLAEKLRIPEGVELKFISKVNEFTIRPVDETVKENNFTNVTNVDGIIVPYYDRKNRQKSNLVLVKSTITNLRSLALAVASGKAIILVGPVGSGKTSLVEHLVLTTGRKGVAFRKVQLGDQTDSRMLLGSHQCTDVPGEFVWRPGVLTEAVQNGHWLLLEDIDCATLDVASTLSSLLERNVLCVPGYRDALPVAPGFQLFVTQRSIVTNFGFQKKMSSSSTLLQKHLAQVNVEPLSRLELQNITHTLYPALTTISERMIEVFMMFSVGSHDSSLHSTKESSDDKESFQILLRGSRPISTRDLIKWCARAVQGYDVSSPESALKVLQDALDIFTSSISSPDQRLELSKKIGTSLGVVDTKTEFYCKHHKPSVSLYPSNLEVGRAKVPRVGKTLETIDLDNKQVVFSFTRQSACLLEKIACCITSNEPVLLVGETGTGKTSSVQYLARQTGHKLVVINMNQQSDSADLLGGYKPVDMKLVIKPIVKEFDGLFRSFYNVEKNQKFLGHIDTCFETENWNALLKLMTQSHKAAVTRLSNDKKEEVLRVWLAFGEKLAKLEKQIKSASKLTFAFIEGSLVKAMQEGYWVLLDEINLASAEILECLSGLLDDKTETIELIEKGDKVPIKRHPNFTLFACMNPATDVGKKDLPVGLRNRFTEFFIDELTERNDLMLLIGDYLYHLNLSGAMLEAMFSFYSSIKKEAKLNLVDGSGNAPHYSLRTLCRALTAAAKAKCGTVARSLYESFCLSFLTQLDSGSHPKVEQMIAKAVLGKKSAKSILNQAIPEPQVPGQKFLLFEGHWIPQGKLEVNVPDGYILTPTVRKNLRDIARIISLGRLPILLQGDTSVGKTSLVTYIAKASGNFCVRINNHEHTDIQEYIGAYATDVNGRLVFKEGVLVEAMRKGYWIILDELNLAPSDVLEALNRVLDDNRELFIPETQQVVKADPNFMLFATQNPPGLYGGRKMLSRAFRNRFVELHFDEIPRSELETIINLRCHVPMTYSKKMIAVMAELQTRRRGSAAVQGKDGFITLRDLFRWGQRYKLASKEMLTDDKFYDWDQHIADEGYLVLAGKVRKTDERIIIEEVIQKHIKRKVTPDNLFTLHEKTSPVTKNILESILNNKLEEFSHVVWTYNMRRLGVLIAKSFIFNEPVLLVGETGCGKTTICQVLAAMNKRQLLSVNCHMHTESSDFLGSLRPVRQYKNDGRLFEWVDGPLVQAMIKGEYFLADEVSLADDSVLERMNSLLEPERQLVLSERGMEENSDVVIITAHENFHFVGTMNPGGDFGKKELSPALRNRFTEIWCDSVMSKEDLLSVLEQSVSNGISLGNQEDGSSGVGSAIIEFTEWLKMSEVTNKFPFSLRDLLSWVQFVNVTVSKGLLEAPEAYVHGACMVFLDCFGTALTGHVDIDTLNLLRTNAIEFLLNQIKSVGTESAEHLYNMLNGKQAFEAESDNTRFGIKPFYIEVGPSMDTSEDKIGFKFTAPTTGSNTLRLLRGLQLNKAVLLEGNPGVGKTSLVTALAKSSGHKVVRINLSDQTDITDLFGTDLPTEDGSFQFKEGVFLRALQNGDWILLDELNLAPQPVLEGLNACLDHRGEVFIPELGKTFKVKEQTRLFACQNPLKQGGARRGLPVSFLNRFTQVYVDSLTSEDLLYIVKSQYPNIEEKLLDNIVKLNCRISHEITDLRLWGHSGSPWDLNLRDIQRWCNAILEDKQANTFVSPGKIISMLYVHRMRTAEDREKVFKIYDEIFESPRPNTTPYVNVDSKSINIGGVILKRNTEKAFKNRRVMQTSSVLLRTQMLTLQALMQSVKMNWLTILVGPTATGKSTVIQTLADLTFNDLHVIPVTSAMDVSDLLGGYEQVDLNRNLENIFDKIETLTIRIVRNMWLKQSEKKMSNLMSHLYEYNRLLSKNGTNSNDDMIIFNDKISFLLKHCESLVKYTNTLDSELSQNAEDLKAALVHLQNKAAKSTALNAGGKFEWVDSLLVKAMLEGSWLLLDNVNLTSAAVLDRLNGLLEPGGVLTIPERGEVSEIKPHPNFRLFFTMDPKYGEISRAMRNRGLEVFMLRADHVNAKLTDMIPYTDLSALLLSSDLPVKYHNVFIKCHDLMASYIQGSERPTIFHLMQAAHLTRQQIIRAHSFDVALLNSFTDVYIKPRCSGDFAGSSSTPVAKIKKNMLNSIKIELKDIEVLDVITVSNTLRVKHLCMHSAQEVANQIAYNVIQVNEGFRHYKTNLIHTLFNIFVAYQRCPKEILYVLFSVIDTNFDQRSDFSAKQKVYSQALNDIAAKYFTAYGTSFSSQRFYPELFPLSDNKIQTINTGCLNLYVQLISKYYLNIVSTDEGIKVIDYSKAVRLRNLRDDFAEYPILRNCSNYLELVEEFVEQVIRNAQDSLDDKTTMRIIHLLNWKNRFYDVAFSGMFFKSDDSRVKILNLAVVKSLYLHSKWLHKHLLEELFKLLPPGLNIEEDFHSRANLLIGNNNMVSSNLSNISKKIRKLYGQPNLYANQEQHELCITRRNLINEGTIDLVLDLGNQSCILQSDYSAIGEVRFAVDVTDEETLDSVMEKIEANKRPLDETSIMKIPWSSYVLQRVIYAVKDTLYSVISELTAFDKKLKSRKDLSEVLRALVHLGSSSKCINPEFLSILEYLRGLLTGSIKLADDRISHLPARFFVQLYNTIAYSPAEYSLAFFNMSPLAPPSGLSRAEPEMRTSMNLPLLAHYVKNLTITEDPISLRTSLVYEKVSLVYQTEYSKQLSSLQNLIWKNMATLTIGTASSIESDMFFEMKKFEELIFYMACAISEHYLERSVTLEYCIVKLREHFVDEPVFLNVLHLATQAREKINTEPSTKLKKLTARLYVAELSLLTNILFINFMAEVKPVDHVEKYRIKVKYIEEDLSTFESLLGAYYIQGLVFGNVNENKPVTLANLTTELLMENKEKLKALHPYCNELLRMREETRERVYKYATGNTYRAQKPKYQEFYQYCKHLQKSIFSPTINSDLIERMLGAANDVLDFLNAPRSTSSTGTGGGGDGGGLTTLPNPGPKTTTWLKSVNNAYKEIDEKYSEAFPDLALPLKWSLAQIRSSVVRLNDFIVEMVAMKNLNANLNRVVNDLINYPNNIPRVGGKTTHFNRFLTKELATLLNRHTPDVNPNRVAEEAEFQSVQVLKMNLHELKMYALAAESLDQVAVSCMMHLFNKLVEVWQIQERDIEQQKQDDEALYVTQSKCEDENEEETTRREIANMFPAFSERDFSDFKPTTLSSEETPKIVPTSTDPRIIITPEDISLVYHWNLDFMRYMTVSEWLPKPKQQLPNDVITALEKRYLVFSWVVGDRENFQTLDNTLEGVISPTLMTMLAHIKDKVEGTEPSDSKLDFYQSPWVSETRQCLPLLQDIKSATEKLLKSWPDFPSLKDIKRIVNRILNFPITSPVSRFLTGLELLRDKIEEWNKNAHKDNNLIEESLAVGQQIVNWRKLEMGHWKECLNNIYLKKQSEGHKSWFFLYPVISVYLKDEVKAERLIDVLRGFMENSNLAEYQTRLNVLFIHHCHLVHLKPDEKRDEVISILWNTYIYYAQYSAQVAAYIKEKRAPIEKRLRDFVKICSWDRDLSYWSVKDTVDKAHKALHKHTKEFENILKESVRVCLVDNSTESGSEHVGIWDRPKRATGAAAPAGGAYMIDTQNFLLLARNVKKYLDQSEQTNPSIPEASLLNKTPSLMNKAKTLCKDIMTQTNYPTLVQSLDDFVTVVIETSTHLGSLEVDGTLPKEKQISQAKSFVQQKRKALADLFKYLSKMGLNYRTGLLILSTTNNELFDFTTPPVDLDVMLSHLKNKRCDASLSLLWSGCESYYQKNIARHRLLTTALNAPHQDLGMPNIERCKGFAAQLAKITNTQKQSISKYSRYLYDIRTITSELTNAMDANTTYSNVFTLDRRTNVLTECFVKCSLLIDQFIVVLKSCPEKTLAEAEFDEIMSESPIARCFKNTDEWNKLYSKIKSMKTMVNKQKTELFKFKPAPIPIGQHKAIKPLVSISQNQIDCVDCATKTLDKLLDDVNSLLDHYRFTLKYQALFHAQELNHPLLRCFDEMMQYLEETIEKIRKLEEPRELIDDDAFTKVIVKESEDLTATMLLIIQSIYKKHSPQTNDNTDILKAIDEIVEKDKEDKEESRELLEDKHLKEHLQDKLTTDARMLQLESLVGKCFNMRKMYVKYLVTRKNCEAGKDAIMRMIPIMEQTVLLVQYFITQKVAVHRVTCKMLSVLLKIFTDLATKGFCKPSDLDTEEGEGEGGPGKVSGGMGLGDGEGQKDVSDRIENQDQLDDARRPGEEDKQEDKDCKEEEKGVNMTDDFDSHLQDVDQKEGETSDKEDDEEDADKQMGDIDNAAEKLDQQIWGSEDEEDIDEQQKKDKEEKGQGESTGEKEMGAKEEEQGKDDGSEGKDRKQKKDINEMEEPEVDDDHVDPYHGNQQQMPEPEDFEMPDNMNMEDGEEEDKDGETETENPFEINVTKDDMPKEPDTEDDKGKDDTETNHGTEVSSDEETADNETGENETGDNETGDTENSEMDQDKTEKEKTENSQEDDKADEEESSADTQPTDETDQTEDSPDTTEKEELPNNPEKMDVDDEVEQKNQQSNPQANPSNNDPSAGEKAENAQMDKGTDDNVDTNSEQKKDEESAPFEQAQEQVGEEKQSMGRSELDKSERGHRGEKEAASRSDGSQEQNKKHENKPGKTDQERTLGDINEKKNKQMKSLNVEREDETEDGGDGDEDKDADADAYQHVKQANKNDLQAIDAATKEQAEQQPTLQQDDEEGEKPKEDEDVAMDVDDEELQMEKAEEVKPEKVKGKDKEKDTESSGVNNDGDEDGSRDIGIEVDGDTVLTLHVPRGSDTTYHTRLEESKQRAEDMSVDQYMSIREWVQAGGVVGGGDVGGVWRRLWANAATPARALCERLRLVLEPTGRSRKAGDFRTGRAINMRRVIPYIASHFRKDRIWLRRTKPAKREYKIAIAVDDSSSMSDNRSKELAFESLALVSQALNLLESGDLAVLSFGEKPNLLHPFTEQFSEHSGSKILEHLRFDQTKTKIAELLDFVTVMFEEQTMKSDAVNAKLLVVVSDGRGIFSEGETRVIQAVRRARQQGVFLVYVIIDNPENKDSIMDIRRPILNPVTGTLSGFIPYLDTFPFPFYLILRDMDMLPTVLGDALRQWFELAANES